MGFSITLQWACSIFPTPYSVAILWIHKRTQFSSIALLGYSSTTITFYSYHPGHGWSVHNSLRSRDAVNKSAILLWLTDRRLLLLISSFFFSFFLYFFFLACLLEILLESGRRYTLLTRLRSGRRIMRIGSCWAVRSVRKCVMQVFHTRTCSLQGVVLEQAQLLHNRSTVKLAEMEDVQGIMEDVVRNGVCLSNGMMERKFQKRFFFVMGQLMFDFLPFMPTSGKVGYVDHFYMMYPMDTLAKYRSRFWNDVSHESWPGVWGLVLDT